MSLMMQQAARNLRQQLGRVTAAPAQAYRRTALSSASAAAAPHSSLATFHSAAATKSAAPLAASSQQQEDDQSSSSSSSSSSPFSTPFVLLGTLFGAVGGAVLLRSDDLAAEAALEPPASFLVEPTLPERKRGKKGKKKNKRVEDRSPLPYPGKLTNFHRETGAITNVQTWQGLQLSVVTAAFQDESIGKNYVFQLIGNLGGGQGDSLQFWNQTTLGRKHTFDGVIDSGGGLQGNYKYNTDMGLTINPTFMMAPGQQSFGLNLDLKRKEWGAQLILSPMQGEASLAFSHPITKSLAMGTELHYTIMGPCHLNAGLKYKNFKENFAMSKKDSSYHASYSREIFREYHWLNPSKAPNGPPDAVSFVGADVKVNPSSGKSDLVVGLKHQRHHFNYHASISTEPRVEIHLDMDPMWTGSPLRLGFTGSVPFTGKAEDQAVFGISMALQA